MGQHFLAGAGRAGDQHAGLGRCNLVGHLHGRCHFRVLEDQRMLVFGDGFEYSGDQFRIRRQGHVFPGPGADRPDCGLGVV